MTSLFILEFILWSLLVAGREVYRYRVRVARNREMHQRLIEWNYIAGN